MAVIRIEDLSPAEKLTPEEIERIFGAGRKPSHLGIESLEARDMMDAGLGHVLGSALPAIGGGVPPEMAHVRVLNAAQNNVAVSYAALGSLHPAAAAAGLTSLEAAIASLAPASPAVPHTPLDTFWSGLDMGGLRAGMPAMGTGAHAAQQVAVTNQRDANIAGEALTNALNRAWAGQQRQGATIDGFQFQSATGNRADGFYVVTDVSLNGGKDHQTVTFYLNPTNRQDGYFPVFYKQSQTGFQFDASSKNALCSRVPLVVCKFETTVQGDMSAAQTGAHAAQQVAVTNQADANIAGRTLVDKLNSNWAGKPFSPGSLFTYDNFRVQSAEGTRSTGFFVDVLVTYSAGGNNFQQTLRFQVANISGSYYVALVAPRYGVITADQQRLADSIGFLPLDFGATHAVGHVAAQSAEPAHGQASGTAAQVRSGYSPSPQAEADAAGRTLVDNLNRALAGRYLQGGHGVARVDGFQFQSAQLDAYEESFTVTVTVSLDGGKYHQTLTFSYKATSDDANQFVSGDIVESENGFQFTGESLVNIREQGRFLYANIDPARKAGQTLRDALDTAWAGKQLQGQTIDGFRVMSTEGTEFGGFTVMMDVSLNGGRDHQILTFKLTPRQKDVYSLSVPTQELRGGFQFSSESLATLQAGLPSLPVHFESAQRFGS